MYPKISFQYFLKEKTSYNKLQQKLAKIANYKTNVSNFFSMHEKYIYLLLKYYIIILTIH